MNIPVLNLMFSYKGKISSREFRVGLSILFLCLGAQFTMNTLGMLPATFLQYMDMDHHEYTRFNILSNLMISFQPTFVPFSFILSYSSIILAVKRMRDLESGCFLTICSGIANYLLFASIPTLVYYYSYHSASSSYFSIELDTTIYLLITFFLIGMLNIILLSINRGELPVFRPSSKHKLDPYGYALRVGNLMIISLFGSVILTGPFVANNLFNYGNSQDSINIIIGTLASLLLLFLLTAQIVLMVYRIRDTKYPPYWIAIILAGYLVINILLMAGIFFLKLELYLVFMTFAYIITALQFLLFLLPSEEEKMPVDTSQI